jgi:regulator of nucleoside diphosphate kinase
MPLHIPERTLTELDHVRLTHLLHGRGGAPATPNARLVGDLLDAAQVVPSRAIPPDIVTMYSQVLLQDLHDGTRSTLALCWPADAEPAAGFVSVLSPVGRALLGLRVGEVARWTTPDGRTRAAEVVALLFQPEASGDYTL